MFGFRSFGPKLYRSDFGHAKLNRFINKGGHKEKIYSRCPKTGRPDFGAFHLCPVCESSGFQTLSTNRTF